MGCSGPSGHPGGVADRFGDLVEHRRADVGHLILGRRLRSEEEATERLSKPVALAVFASDALSSVAYATQEMLVVLVPVVGLVAYRVQLWLSLAVVGLLCLLVASYRQTVRAYPSAGGAYAVTRDNFGLGAAQVAGVALLTDYVLTVAVSMSSAVAAAYSAVPSLVDVAVPLALAGIWLIAAVNLRGIRASGRVFAVPTYAFILAMGALVVVGAGRAVAGTLPPAGTAEPATTEALTVFLVLRAFASGCTAMTGVEAISNGVSAFRPVEWRNARTILVWLGAVLVTMFLGTAVLAARLRPPLTADTTTLSELGRAVFGHGGAGDVAYGVFQGATALILALAVNTSFADFPRLTSFQAHDHFLAESFRTRGRRLAFSHGIIVLAVLGSVLVAATGASVTRLVPLYAVGVFLSFTMSQTGMFRHHLRRRETGWRQGLVINGAGAVVTALVLVVIAVTKFSEGAWVVVLIVPAVVGLLHLENHHLRRVERELAAGPGPGPRHRTLRTLTVPAGAERALREAARGLDPVVLVPRAPAGAGAGPVEDAGRERPPAVALVLVGELVASAVAGVAVARELGVPVRALHVAEWLDEDVPALRRQWEAQVGQPPLEVVPAPYREVVTPVLDAVRRTPRPAGRDVWVVLGMVAPPRPWQLRLHNQRARPLVAALLAEPGIRVVVVPHPVGRR